MGIFYEPCKTEIITNFLSICPYSGGINKETKQKTLHSEMPYSVLTEKKYSEVALKRCSYKKVI